MTNYNPERLWNCHIVTEIYFIFAISGQCLFSALWKHCQNHFLVHLEGTVSIIGNLFLWSRIFPPPRNRAFQTTNRPYISTPVRSWSLPHIIRSLNRYLFCPKFRLPIMEKGPCLHWQGCDYSNRLFKK